MKIEEGEAVVQRMLDAHTGDEWSGRNSVDAEHLGQRACQACLPIAQAAKGRGNAFWQARQGSQSIPLSLAVDELKIRVFFHLLLDLLPLFLASLVFQALLREFLSPPTGKVEPEAVSDRARFMYSIQ